MAQRLLARTFVLLLVVSPPALACSSLPPTLTQRLQVAAERADTGNRDVRRAGDRLTDANADLEDEKDDLEDAREDLADAQEDFDKAQDRVKRAETFRGRREQELAEAEERLCDHELALHGQHDRFQCFALRTGQPGRASG